MPLNCFYCWVMLANLTGNVTILCNYTNLCRKSQEEIFQVKKAYQTFLTYSLVQNTVLHKLNGKSRLFSFPVAER